MSATTPSAPRRPRRAAPASRPPRRPAPSGGDAAGAVDPLRARHLALERATIEEGGRRVAALVNAAESPLMWLARRKGRDGRPLIAPEQLAAGERLRADFTRAQMTPRLTADWTAPVAGGRRGDAAPQFTEAVTAARQRVRRALDGVGPEFSGLLVDVCCFLKGLDDVERARQWPSRAAKVVLQLGLDRLARHYGCDAGPRGGGRAPLRAWRADGAAEEA